MEVKLLLVWCISACIVSLSCAQSCTNEGAEVQNRCGESCICTNGRMQNCCRMRKDFTSMTTAERTLYVTTVRRASTEAPFRDEYRRLINIHQRLFQTGIHQKDQFLPWHRWYENLLRRVNCRVTVPYWDWSLFSMTPWRTDRSRIWFSGPSGLGGNGVGGSRCVASGVFRSNSWTKTDGQCLRRRFNGLPPDIIAVYTNQLHSATTAGFDTFELNLRVNLHDTVHCRVGGDMCEVTSANAPEFFLHHAFIDKIWANWQEFSENHMTVHFQNINRNMGGTSYRPSDFIDNLDMPDPARPGRRTCVLYEDPTHPVYNEIIQRLEGMTRQQIRALPRHRFAPLNNRQMRFFNINRQERREARRSLRRELEPRNELRGNAGLTGISRNLGFDINSLPANNRNKRSVLRRKLNSMRERWINRLNITELA
ncbi:uncharacterized protein LOC144628048 isoform X2 [Oculina patagonica]